MSERTTFHYWSDTATGDPFLEYRRELKPELTQLDPDDLMFLASTALDAAGVKYLDLELEREVHNYGTTSIVHLLRLETAKGTENYVLRAQPLTPIEKKRHYYSVVERVVQQRCAEARVYTPRILATDQDLQAGERPLFTFSIEDYIPGSGGHESIAHHPQLTVPIIRLLGEGLAQIHQLRPNQGIGPFRIDAGKQGGLIGTFDNYRERMLSYLPNSLRRLKLYEYLTPDQAEALFEYYCHDPIIDTIGHDIIAVLHGDYGLHNTRVSDEQNRPKLAVLDFGDTQAGPVVQDLAVASVFLHRAGLAHVWPELLQGYLQGGGKLPDHFDASLPAVRLRMSVSLLSALAKCEHTFSGTISSNYLNTVLDLLHDDAETLQIDL